MGSDFSAEFIKQLRAHAIRTNSAWAAWSPLQAGSALRPSSGPIAAAILYRHVLVDEPSRRYFWILSREIGLAEEELNRLLKKAQGLGFKVDQVEYSWIGGQQPRNY